MRGPSRSSKIKPVALEYDRSKRYLTLIFKFIDLLNYSIVFDAISARRKNLVVGGFPTGPSLLVS
jgi:hypothetical protein